MDQKIFCRADAWHQFQSWQDRPWEDSPALIFIPEGEDEAQISAVLAGARIQEIITIPRFLERYVRERCGKRLLARHEVESILGAIMSDKLAAYLNIERFKQSYVKALTDFIHGFRSTSLADLHVAIAGLRTEQFSLKENDLVKIHRELETRLPEHGFDLRSALLEFMRRSGTGELSGLPGCGKEEQVLFYGFNYLTLLEEEFIFTVFQHAHRACLFFCEDANAPEKAVLTAQSVSDLVKRLSAPVLEGNSPPQADDGFFASAAKSLFKPASLRETPDSGRPIRGGTVHILEANSRAAETAAVARRIRRMTETGVPLSQIRVIAPAYPLYSAVIKEIFPDYGIPFHLEQGISLTRFPLAAVILRLVTQQISANPYPVREKIFTSPYVSFSAVITPAALLEFQDLSGAELLPAHKIDGLLKPGAACTLDYKLLKTLRLKALRLVRPAPGTAQAVIMKSYFDGQAEMESPAQEQLRFRYLTQSYLQTLAERRLSAWPPRMGARDFAAALRERLDEFHVRDNIHIPLDDGALEAKTISRDKAVLERVEQLLAELSEADSPGGLPAGELPFVELAHNFTHRMNEASLAGVEDPLPPQGGFVTVQAANRGQYRKWPYTFICGMVDGEFPAREEFNFLQPKKEGLGLGRRYTSVDYGRNQFYQMIRSTDSGLFLSRPLSDQGKKLSPSPFLQEMGKWAEASRRDCGSNESPADDRQFFSRRDKLTFIARRVDSAYPKARPLLEELKTENRDLYRKVSSILRYDGLTMNTTSFSEFDGLFPGALSADPEAGPAGEPSSSASLLKISVGEMAFTPAVLQRYASCPMRFFFDDLLRLRSTPDYHPDTAEGGQLARGVLKAYSEAACAAGRVPEEAHLLLKETAGKRLQELEQIQGGSDAFQLRFINSLIAGLDEPAARRPGLLRAFLDYETDGPDRLRPYLANIKGTVALPGGLEICLELDRVDVTEAGDYLLAFFYTAAPPGSPSRISRGLRFDLPLAVLLCRDMAQKGELDLPVAGAGLYLVKNAKGLRRGGYFALEEIRAARRKETSPERPVFSGQREGFLSPEEFSQALAEIEAHLLRLHRLMKSGVYHLPLSDESEQDCENCQFGRACRKEQLRLERLKRVYSRQKEAGEKVHLVSDLFVYPRKGE